MPQGFKTLRSLIGPNCVARIELVVDANAQDVVGDAGIESDRGRRIRYWRWNGRDRSQIEVVTKLPTAAQILKKSRLHPWLYFTAVGYNPRFHSSRLAKVACGD
jgi:hypothetical protein